jgi:hypothetical protein
MQHCKMMTRNPLEIAYAGCYMQRTVSNEESA